MPSKSERKKFGTYLPEPLIDRLKSASDASGISIQRIVERAVEEHLDREYGTAARKTRR